METGTVFSYQFIDGKLTLVDIRENWDFSEEIGKKLVVTKIDVENGVITLGEK